MEEAGSPDEVNANVNWKGRLALKPSPHSTLLNEEGRIVSAGQHGSRPIADPYSESTIMFADIVGFTQWASCRVPT
jgi:class 3 adenylate cyclase